MFHKKQIFKLNILRQLLTDEKSCVSLVSTNRLLALPPFFLNDMKSGILYMLNAMLKKYDRSLGGIIIGYQNIKVLMDENTGIIPIGTSETEVNISVEFYIFQPKIGNYLEGVINKKSNNHIGCLVHKYFNATILKPEDIDYEDWICKDFSVDDTVTFKVKDLDFTTLLPYIEGIVDDNTSVKNIKRNVTSKTDVIMNHVNESSESESLFSKKLSKNVSSKDKKFKSEFLDNKKAKNRNEEEVSELEDSINTSSGEFKSFTSPKKKEKKKKEKIDLEFDDHNKREEERSSKDKELTPSSFNNEHTTEERHHKKKKKKKKKEEEEEENKYDNGDGLSAVKNLTKERSSKDKELTPSSSNNEHKAEERHHKKKKKKKKKEEEEDNKRDSGDEGLSAVKNSTKEEDPMMNFLEKCFQIENENSDAFVKEGKSKKVKKKKKDEKHSLDFNKTSTCLPVEEAEDNMFYSTQLEPVSERKKMSMPYLSPILSSAKERNNEMTTPILNFSAHLNSDKDSQEKEKKKKHKKRKVEEKDESAGEPAPKKMKTSHTSRKKVPEVKVNGVDPTPDTRMLMEEMYKKLLNDAKEQLNLSEKDSSKVKKKKKESKSREKKAGHSQLSKNSITQVNGSEEKSEVQSILDRLLENEMKRVKESSYASDREKSRNHDKSKTDKQKKLLKERSKSSSSKVKKHSKSSVSHTNGEDSKSGVHHGS